MSILGPGETCMSRRAVSCPGGPPVPAGLEARLSRCRSCGIACSKSPCYPGDWAVLVRRANESVSGLGRGVRHCLQVRGVAALVLLLDGMTRIRGRHHLRRGTAGLPHNVLVGVAAFNRTCDMLDLGVTHLARDSTCPHMGGSVCIGCPECTSTRRATWCFDARVDNPRIITDWRLKIAGWSC